jgi:hypothetical protein
MLMAARVLDGGAVRSGSLTTSVGASRAGRSMAAQTNHGCEAIHSRGPCELDSSWRGGVRESMEREMWSAAGAVTQGRALAI